MPTFVQVMVSSAYADPSAAPGFVLECFTRAEPEPPRVGSRDAHFVASTAPRTPALFGGTVTGAIGGAGAVVDGFGGASSPASCPASKPWRSASPTPVCRRSSPRRSGAESPSRRSTITQVECVHHTRTTRTTRTTKRTPQENDRRSWRRWTLSVRGLRGRRDVHRTAARGGAGRRRGGRGGEARGALFSGSEEVTSVPTRDAPGAKEGERSGSAGPFGDDATFSKTSSARVSSSSARASSCASHGAVGVILVGDFEMEAHSLHAHRPVGPPMTLTRAGADGVVLDLDGRRRRRALRTARRLAGRRRGHAGDARDARRRRFRTVRTDAVHHRQRRYDGGETARRRHDRPATTTTTMTKTTAVLTTFSSPKKTTRPTADGDAAGGPPGSAGASWPMV